MKRYTINGALALMIICSSFAAGAQKNKDTSKTAEQQVIVITRNGAGDEKIIIELSPGGQVLINGKAKTDDVSVNITRIKDGEHHIYTTPYGGGQSWNFNGQYDSLMRSAERLSASAYRLSLFSEDSNRAMLGITTGMDARGAEVVTVQTGSAAEKAGLKKGDIITQIGDKKIKNPEDVSVAVSSHKPGDQVTIVSVRADKEQKLTAKLDKYKGIVMGDISIFRNNNKEFTWPTPMAPLRGFIYNGGRPKLGLSIQDTDDGKGVKVLDVSAEGAAAKAGIKKGDVITHADGKTVNSTDEISRHLRDVKDKSTVQFKVLRGGKTQTVEVKWPRKLKTADL